MMNDKKPPFKSSLLAIQVKRLHFIPKIARTKTHSAKTYPTRAKSIPPNRVRYKALRVVAKRKITVQLSIKKRISRDNAKIEGSTIHVPMQLQGSLRQEKP